MGAKKERSRVGRLDGTKRKDDSSFVVVDGTDQAFEIRFQVKKASKVLAISIHPKEARRDGR